MKNQTLRKGFKIEAATQASTKSSANQTQTKKKRGGHGSNDQVYSGANTTQTKKKELHSTKRSQNTPSGGYCTHERKRLQIESKPRQAVLHRLITRPLSSKDKKKTHFPKVQTNTTPRFHIHFSRKHSQHPPHSTKDNERPNVRGRGGRTNCENRSSNRSFGPVPPPQL